MSSRWSLNNWLLPVSFEQFVDLTKEFQAACEKEFGGECSLSIQLMNANKVFTTFWLEDNEMALLDAQNESRTFAKLDNIDDVTKEMWQCAKYVDVRIDPKDKGNAPDHAFAYLEFKGYRPKAATYYIQPNGENAERAITDNHGWMRKGSGYDYHGSQRAGGFMSVGAKLGMPSSLVSEVLTKSYKFDI